MKKLLLILCVFVSISAMGQDKKAVQEAKSMTFYGVDYTHAKVYGAAEAPFQFKSAFYDINQLFVTEAKKYNVAKALKRSFVENNLAVTLDQVNKIAEEDIVIQTNSYTIDNDVLQSIVNSIEVNKTEDMGLIIVGELLDKSTSKGSYHVVFFDQASKEIVLTYREQTKAKGFGLRNFWARSVYNILQGMKKRI